MPGAQPHSIPTSLSLLNNELNAIYDSFTHKLVKLEHLHQHPVVHHVNITSFKTFL